jgi:hypothetical protein
MPSRVILMEFLSRAVAAIAVVAEVVQACLGEPLKHTKTVTCPSLGCGVLRTRRPSDHENRWASAGKQEV